MLWSLQLTACKGPTGSCIGGVRMRNHVSAKMIVVMASAWLWVTQPLRADVTGAILGVVTDPTGAAVPGAKVDLRNQNTGLERKASTDATGSYEFLAVPAGENYVLEVVASGFQKSTQSNLTLLVNQRF